MRIAQFQQRVSSSLAGARTTAQLQRNPISRQVRNQRFIPQQTAADMHRQGIDKAHTILAAGNAIGSIVNAAGQVAQRIDNAEAQAQYDKGIALYQKNVAKFRAGQLSRDIVEADEDGNPYKPSETFAKDYEANAANNISLLKQIGIDNPKAIKAIEATALNIDNEYLTDINKHVNEVKIDLAITDKQVALDSAVSIGRIQELVVDGANKGLWPFNEVQQRVKDATQKMTMRGFISRVNSLPDMANNTSISSQALDDFTHNILDDAYLQYELENLTSSSLKEIETGVRRSEDQRAEVRLNQQQANEIGAWQAITEAQLNGSGHEVITQSLLSSGASDTFGPTALVSMLKAVQSANAGGAPDREVMNQAANMENQLYSGLIEHSDYVEWVQSNAEQLGSSYSTVMSSGLTAHRDNLAEEAKSAVRLAKRVLTDTRVHTDDDGNPTYIMALEMNVLEDMIQRHVKSGEDHRDASEWVLNWYVDRFFSGDEIKPLSKYIPRGTAILDIDITKLKEAYIADLNEHNAQFQALPTLEFIPYSEANMDGLGFNDWRESRRRAITKLDQFQGVVSDTSLHSMIDDKAKVGIDE